MTPREPIFPKSYTHPVVPRSEFRATADYWAHRERTRRAAAIVLCVCAAAIVAVLVMG